mmetsp:Transcript_21/g.73  ORF Transcript_21/g.73 Transcript_21/m.73 type:complete len:247 (+) Transcript_21:426-1166(+)
MPAGAAALEPTRASCRIAFGRGTWRPLLCCASSTRQTASSASAIAVLSWSFLLLVIEVNRVRQVDVLLVLLLECILGNDLEGLLHIDIVLCTRLKEGQVALRLAPGEGALLRYDARVHIHLVPQHDEGEVVWVPRPRLDEELITPAVEVVESFSHIHIKAEHTRVRTAVEGHAQALKPFLTRGVPDLHGDRPVVHDHLLGKEVGTDSGLVLCGEFVVHVLVHERRLAHAAVAEDYHLEQHLLAGHG